MGFMDINLTGQAFSDYKLTDVGSDAYQLEHDWFTKEDLVITTEPGGGGTPLSEGTDYQLSEEDEELSQRVTAAVGSTRTVYHYITIINATYQTGDLYHSGKYIADSNSADYMGLSLITEANLFECLFAKCIPFTPTPWNKSFFAWVTTAIDGDGLAADDAGTAFQLNDADGTDWTTVISAGDVVWNATKNLFATVLHVAAHKLLLDQDIFDSTDVYYIYDEPSLPDNCIELTGELMDGDFSKTADTDTTNRLLDADGTDWTTVVSEGDWVLNVTDGKLARVTSVAAHDLALDWDAFPDGNEIYAIYSNTIMISDIDSLLNEKIIYEMNISGRFCRPGRTAHMAQLDAMQGHWHSGMKGTDGNLKMLAGDYVDTGSEVIDRVGGTSPKTDGEHGTPRTGEETRPRNLSMVMIMRIK